MKSLYLALACVLLLGGAFAQSVPQTPNIHLNEPPYHYQRWDVPNNANWTLLDSFWTQILAGCGGDGSHGIGWDPVLHFQCVGIVGTNAPGGTNGQLQYNNAGALGGFNDGTAHQVQHGLKTFGPVTGLDTDSTIAQTGADINTSFQVTSLHLSAPCPIAMGCTGTATPGLVPGSNITITGAWPNQTITSLAGGPGGSTTQVEFNDSGTHGGNAALTFNKTTGVTTAKYLAMLQGPEVDPIAYGADPTGAVEATSSWITAKTQMEASGGALICKGTYKLDRVPLNGIDYIEGQGDINGGGCIINVKTDAVFVTGVPTLFLAGVTIKNIDFIGGTSPIDLGTGNDIHVENLRIFNNTNCGVVYVYGERSSFVELVGTHTGQNGFATLCTGDKTKSLFSASIAVTGGIARSHIRGIRELGTLGSTGFGAQYLWWGGFGVGGGADSTDAENFTCFFSCSSGYIWMDTLRFSRLSVLDMDHVGTVGSPESVGVKIASMDMASLSHFNAAFNTNFITTQADIGSIYRSSITDSAFCSCDNVTTWGLKLTGGSGLQTSVISGNAGAYFVTANPSHTTTLGNNWSLTNDIGGQHIVDISNLGITFHAEHDFNDTSANTGPFTFRMGTGSGGSFNPFTISSTAITSTLPIVLNDNNHGSTETYAPGSCETSYATTTLNTGATTTDTGLNCLPANAIIDSVLYRITTTITTAANFTIGDATIAARFCGTQSTLTSGTTGVCFVQADQTGTSGPRQASAAKVRITLNANPGAGAIRLIVYYHTWGPPSS